MIAKIPVTAAGLKAIEYLIGEDVPIIATEVMAISQAITVCKLYERACEKLNKRRRFMSPISPEFSMNICTIWPGRSRSV